MDRNEHLYRCYRDEMQSLNEFVMRYHAEHKFSGLRTDLSSEDPDVNRLLESLAFFSARIHDSVIRNLEYYRYRLHQQLFPYLLTPIPSTGVLIGNVSGLVTEPVRIDRGTDFVMRTDNDKDFFFQTLSTTTLLPIYVAGAKLTPLEGVGARLTIDFSAKHPIHDAPSPLSLLLNYIGDTQASFRLLGFFKKNISSMRVRYGATRNISEKEDSDWVDLDLPTFGPKPVELEEDDFLHPIEKERLFFVDPRSELFVNINCKKIEEPFTSFAIEFSFKESWPKGLVVNKDIFLLHCMPIVNMRRLPSKPMLLDGTISSQPILSGHDDAGYELAKVIGVFKLDQGGMEPLISGVVAHDSPCYEIESRVSSIRGSYISNLIVNYPETYEEATWVFVDALWHQPSFSDYRERECKFFPYTLNIPGVQWEWCFLPSQQPSQPGMSGSSDILLDILHITHKHYYNTDDIRTIMQILGSVVDGPYRLIYSAFKSARHELRSVENARHTAGYIIYFLDFDWGSISRDDELFNLFIQHLEKVLNEWSNEKEVRISLEDSK